MATLEERYEMIHSAILRNAKTSVAKLRAEEDDFRKRSLHNAKQSVLNELYDRTQDEITELSFSAPKTESSCRYSLLVKRDEITDKVFVQVKKRLLTYTKTDLYENYMLDLAEKMAFKYPQENLVVLLKKSDYHMAAKLHEIFGENCRIMVDSDMQIGGLRLMNQSSGLFVDESYDNKLEELKPWFYINSGIKVQ